MQWHIDIGQLIEILVLISAVIGAHFSLKSTLAVFGTRLEKVESRLAETIATFSTRLDRHEDAITRVTGELQRVIGTLDRRRGG